jgi:phosphate starvation-inducible protein PhoH and related proteins
MSKTAPKAKRATKKQTRIDKKQRGQYENAVEMIPGIAPDLNQRTQPFRRPLICRTPAQAQYLSLLNSKRLIIADGEAGSGKSFVVTKWAAEQLNMSSIGSIIITRPAVEAADESMGYLPGTIEEKYAPYFEPIRQILLQDFTQTHLDNLFKRGKIQIAPLPFIRGLTFDNAIVILDEAQNTTPKQMKLLLSRIGERSIVVVNGDYGQKDIQGKSGLEDILTRFEDMEDVGRITFTVDDVVRSKFVKDILARY